MLLSCQFVKADFATHYNQAQQYLTNYQYSSAISEFKKALRINYMDNSARIGLVNSYLARGTYLANNDKNWEGAANDYRAALFYLRYYPQTSDVQNSMQAISNSTDNLNKCLQVQKFCTTPKSRLEKARELRLQGLFAEAGYEFTQSLAEPSLRKEAYEQLGDIMKILSNDEKACEYYEKAVAANPDSGVVRLKYARILDKQSKPDEAVKQYNWALANGGDDPEIMYALERIYRKKLEETPNDAPTLTSLGAILQKQNKYDDALKFYAQASQLDPSSVTTRLNVGTLYQQKKSYDSAIAAYDTILSLYPNNKEANLYKAQCLAAQDMSQQAKQYFDKVLALDPNNKEAKSQIFDSLKSTMSPAEMMAYLSKNSTVDSGAIDDMYDYALDLHRQNKFDDAIMCYKEILKIRTSDPEVYLNLGIAYKQKNDIENAKIILQNAKAKFPANKQIADTLNGINQEAVAGKFDEASTFFNNGEFQKALEIYQSVQPPTFDSLSGVAACYKSMNNDVQAIEYYKKALVLSPNSDVAYYIAVLFSEKENWQESKSYLKKALSINPNNQRAKDLLGSVIQQVNIKQLEVAISYYDKNEYAKALPILNAIISEESKNAYALYYRALISDAGKKYTAAIADYKKAVQNAPELSVIYYLLALDYDALAQYTNALSYYKKYVAQTAESNEYKTYSQARIKELKKYETAKK